MKVATETLKELVSKVSIGVGNGRPTITEFIGIKADSDKIQLETTDGANYLFATVECDTDISDGECFEVSVLAEQFMRLIGKINSEDIALSIFDGNLVVRANHGTYTLELHLDENGEPIQYPDPREYSSDSVVKVSTDVIRNIVQTAKASLSTDLERPELTNYYAGDSVFATDGCIVTEYKVKLFDKPMLISAKLMDIISTITDGEVELNLGKDHLWIKSGCIEVYSRFADDASEYEADKVKEYISTDFTHWVKFKKADLISALDRISLFVGKFDNSAVRIVFDRSDAIVSNVKSGSEELVEYTEKKVDKSKKKFEPFEVYVNVQMLTEQLKSYIGDIVTVNYGTDFAISLSSETTTQIVSLMEL